MLSVSSRIADATWPAIPTSRASQLLAVQFQLEQSQWLPPEKLRQFQWQQLQRVVQHAYQHVPFYRRRDRGYARQSVGVNHPKPPSGEGSYEDRGYVRQNVDPDAQYRASHPVSPPPAKLRSRAKLRELAEHSAADAR